MVLLRVLLKEVVNAMPRVHIVGFDSGVSRMFEKKGWDICSQIDEQNLPDLIQFTGGADISPNLYNHPEHLHTFCSEKRDTKEVAIYEEYQGRVKMAGICRGAQLLNVLHGGTLVQHCNNHVSGHLAIDCDNGARYFVTSTHHQMMVPAPEAVILGIALQSTERWWYDEEGGDFVDLCWAGYGDWMKYDIEVLGYPDTLCFQPHPEYCRQNSQCTSWYFELLGELLKEEE